MAITKRLVVSARKRLAREKRACPWRPSRRLVQAHNRNRVLRRIAAHYRSRFSRNARDYQKELEIFERQQGGKRSLYVLTSHSFGSMLREDSFELMTEEVAVFRGLVVNGWLRSVDARTEVPFSLAYMPRQRWEEDESRKGAFARMSHAFTVKVAEDSPPVDPWYALHPRYIPPFGTTDDRANLRCCNGRCDSMKICELECDGCRETRYCDRACMEADRESHAEDCVLFREGRRVARRRWCMGSDSFELPDLEKADTWKESERRFEVSIPKSRRRAATDRITNMIMFEWSVDIGEDLGEHAREFQTKAERWSRANDGARCLFLLRFHTFSELIRGGVESHLVSEEAAISAGYLEPELMSVVDRSKEVPFVMVYMPENQDGFAPMSSHVFTVKVDHEGPLDAWWDEHPEYVPPALDLGSDIAPAFFFGCTREGCEVTNECEIRCDRCGDPRYCGTECKEADRESHRRLCRIMRDCYRRSARALGVYTFRGWEESPNSDQWDYLAGWESSTDYESDVDKKEE